jgi:hypothetical protein
LYWLNRPRGFSSFFGPVRFTSAQLASSHPFSLPMCCLSSATPCHTSFPLNQDELAVSALSSDNASSHHFPSRAETEVLNPYHCRRLPSQTTQLSPSIAIKDYLNLDHSPHHSITSLFCLQISQSTTPSEIHSSTSFPFTIVSRSSSLCTTTPMVIN